MIIFTDSNPKFKNPVNLEFPNREVLFSYCHSNIVGWGTTYYDFDDFARRVALNPNDNYPEGGYWKGFSSPLTIRHIMVTEDNRIIDIRKFKNEIMTASNSLWYKYRAKKNPKQEINMDGVVFRSYRKYPSYKHYVNDFLNPENRKWARGNKFDWCWPHNHGQYATRSWKDQSKSRKQWARHKKNPLKRETFCEVPEEELEVYEEELD